MKRTSRGRLIRIKYTNRKNYEWTTCTGKIEGNYPKERKLNVHKFGIYFCIITGGSVLLTWHTIMRIFKTMI